MKCGVKNIIAREGRASALLLDSGEEVTADHVLSSIGAPETEALCGSDCGLGFTPDTTPAREPIGRLSFIETITVLNRQPAALGWGDDTIVFFNDSARFHYEQPVAQVDPRSGVICLPNNFDFGPDLQLPEGLFRCTCLANHGLWVHLPEADYLAAKKHWYGEVQASAARFMPALTTANALAAATVATDMFTPRTITHFTGHFGGAIYGSPHKHRQGRTALSNVYLCGTDQGFLGIVGAMLSGISMANFHILRPGHQG